MYLLLIDSWSSVNIVDLKVKLKLRESVTAHCGKMPVVTTLCLFQSVMDMVCALPSAISHVVLMLLRDVRLSVTLVNCDHVAQKVENGA